MGDNQPEALDTASSDMDDDQPEALDTVGSDSAGDDVAGHDGRIKRLPRDRRGLEVLNEDAELVIDDSRDGSDEDTGSVRNQVGHASSGSPDSRASEADGGGGGASAAMDSSRVPPSSPDAFAGQRDRSSEGDDVFDMTMVRDRLQAYVDDEQLSSTDSDEHLDGSTEWQGNAEQASFDTQYVVGAGEYVPSYTPRARSAVAANHGQALLDAAAADCPVPSILQYHRESEEVVRDVPSPMPLEQKFHHLYDSQLQCFALPARNSSRSLVCDFCGKLQFGPKEIVAVRPVVKGKRFPVPSEDEIVQLRREGEYCCPEFFESCKGMLVRWIEENEKASVMAPVLIDITPSSHYGSKEARKAAKRRMIDKLIMREYMRRKVGPISFYALKRGKTVSFSLADRSRLPKDWILAPEPGETSDYATDSDGDEFLILPDLKLRLHDTHPAAKLRSKTSSMLPNIPGLSRASSNQGCQGATVAGIAGQSRDAIPRTAMPPIDRVRKTGASRMSNTSYRTLPPVVDAKRGRRRSGEVDEDTLQQANSRLSLSPHSSTGSEQNGRKRRSTTSEIASLALKKTPASRPHHALRAHSLTSPVLPALPSSRLQAAALISSVSSPLVEQLLQGKLSRKYEEPSVRYYSSGALFAVKFPDSTNCCFYPDGSLAVSTSSSEQSVFDTLAYGEDNHECRSDPPLLAVFSPSIHHGCCYTPAGDIRLLLTSEGGVAFSHGDSDRQKRWSWHCPKHLSHLSRGASFQPVCMALSNHISVRCVRQDNIVLTFTHSRCSMRFPISFEQTGVSKPAPVHGANDDGLKAAKSKITSLLRKMNDIQNQGEMQKQKWPTPEYRMSTPPRPAGNKVTRSGLARTNKR